MGDEKRPSGTSSEDAADREREARRDRAERLRRKIAGIVEEAETGREAEKETETPREFVERRMRELEAEEAEREEEEER